MWWHWVTTQCWVSRLPILALACSKGRLKFGIFRIQSPGPVVPCATMQKPCVRVERWLGFNEATKWDRQGDTMTCEQNSSTTVGTSRPPGQRSIDGSARLRYTYKSETVSNLPSGWNSFPLLFTDIAISDHGGEKLSTYVALKPFWMKSPHGISYSNSACRDAAQLAILW